MATYARSEKTRDSLIRATGELASEVGFDNISLRAVARRAGENIGSIRYHFGNKEDLFRAVISSVLEHLDITPLQQQLEDMEDELDTPLGQARAIRIVIRNEMNIIFNKGRLHWYCRIVHQLMQFRGPLRDYFVKGYIEPLTNLIQNLVKRIRPDLTQDQLILYHATFIAPAVFHDDYMETMLELLGKDRYTPDYLQDLEDLVTLQMQLALGLPSDKEHP